MSDAILTINAGSSSIKFELFEADAALARIARGAIENIGDVPYFHIRNAAGAMVHESHWDQTAHTTHEMLLTSLLAWVENHLGQARLIAAGHRIVHGGADFTAPIFLNPSNLAALSALTSLAPLHQPHNLAPVYALAALRPALPQIGCFDTAFHHTMPPVARRLPIPRHLSAAGLQRYGFHGLSYEYIARRLRALTPNGAAGKVIVAHLGNGASLCAMQDGISIDTTMSFTTLDGLMMGTRTGRIDPGVILYCLQTLNMTADDISHLLYDASGLHGVSGISADIRTLLASTDEAAAQAIELFAYGAAREIGALTAILGGCDALVFTAGIGEHAAPVRAMICQRLTWLGLSLDEAENLKNAAIISRPESRITVRVIPTDEEKMIARYCYDLTSGDPGRISPLV